MSISNFLEVELLDHIVGGGSRNWTPPATIYVQLHTADPGEAGTTAVSAETDRQGITGDTDWGAAASGSVATDADGVVEWTAWDVGTETISHISLWDAAAAGNCLWTMALTTPRTIQNGDTLRFSTAAITLTLD